MSRQEKKKEKMLENDVHAALTCDDILNEILLRLPEKFVFRLILVSKRWLRVICSSSFRSDYRARWGVDFHHLGFFVCNQLYLNRPKDGMRRPKSEPALQLLSACEEGDDVCNDLMASGNCKQLGYFIDSCNGLLLCGRHPLTYSVWNPISKVLFQLPQPQRFYKRLCMAFIAEDNFDDILQYKVIRANCECKREVNTVSIETYSSVTGTWKHFTLTCSSKFSLRPWTVATVINGVVYWFATQGKIAIKESVAIYDPRVGNTRVELLKLPDGNISQDYDEFVLGESSDGLLQYGQSSKSGMEIWVLEKEQDSSISSITTNVQSNRKWKIRYRLGFKAMWKKNPSFCKQTKEAQLLSFLPRNSEYVFIRSGQNIFLLHIESQMLKVNRYHGPSSHIQWDFSRVVPYFQPSWPRSSLCHEKAATSAWPSTNQETAAPAWPSW
ncbi:PREDICTED: F-box protein At5g03970 [Fragaria vesca subsp. vesca]|uniref:F-box protein At5g03970 n=1 Tax=Fragaria vesca subsp. vesca TaxID=101020 RepID=UPI0002C33F1B|nr:PREDICTED: F-box protein At5g03970 [Fragaria vesca subsp. vesca]XP_011465976.1 PREDICTED: F-box protein At5g03970 [Fragaria vesca subsp. vesca]XP_011465977.1 PREDICTED: F-box protein At5g03970 [Fragaria vesca subsp. vesca]